MRFCVRSCPGLPHICCVIKSVQFLCALAGACCGIIQLYGIDRKQTSKAELLSNEEMIRELARDDSEFENFQEIDRHISNV